MFLPVFVHPGKRGPSPVKKSPEKSTAKGGPPTPPPAWPPSTSIHGVPPASPRSLFSTPSAWPVECMSLPALSLVARKKNIYVLSRYGSSTKRSRAPAFFSRVCVNPALFHAYVYTHLCVHWHERQAATSVYVYACLYSLLEGRKRDKEIGRGKEKEVKRWLHHAGVVNVCMQRCRWMWTRRDTYARVETVVRAERRTWPRCFRVCNLDSQWFHILLPLEPIHKWANNAFHSSDRYKRVFGTLSRAPEHTRVFSARAGTGRNEEMGKEKGNGRRGIKRERWERGRSVTVGCRNTIADRDERKSERDKSMCVWMCVWGGQAKREGLMRKRRPPTEGQRERVGGRKRGGYPPVWIASSMHRRIGFPCDSSWQSRSSSLANEKLLPCLHPVTRKVWHGSPKLILSRDD